MAHGTAAWQLSSWRLPDVGLQALPVGCGLDGDDDASWIVWWHGSVVSWARTCHGSGGSDASRGSEVSSSTFVAPGEEAIRVARPVPAVDAIVIVFTTGRIAMLLNGVTLAPLSEELRAADVWPVRDGLMVLTLDGQLTNVGAEFSGNSSECPRPVGENLSALDGVSAASLCRVPSGEVCDALVAAAGQLAGRSTARVWQLRGTEVDNFTELVIPVAQELNDGEENAATDVAIAIGLAPSKGRICILQGDGRLVVVARAEGIPAWSMQMQLSAFRVSGLRYCACAGLDPVILDTEVDTGVGEAPMARAMHVWDDGTLGLIFPGAPDQRTGLATPEVVCLDPVTLGLVAVQPHRTLAVFPLPSENGKGRCIAQVAGCGSVGTQIAFAVVQEDGATSRVVGNVLACLARTPTERALLRADRARARALTNLADPSVATVQQFHEILATSDVLDFVERVLQFDPFPGDLANVGAAVHSFGGVSFGCEQMQRLLVAAESRLRHVLEACGQKKKEAAPLGDGWDIDGWDVDDFEGLVDDDVLPSSTETSDAVLPEELVSKLNGLLGRVELQLNRLRLFRQLHGGDRCSLTWAGFRETAAASLRRQACLMVAEQCVPGVEALFGQEPEALMPSWMLILDALPETTPVDAIRRILPAAPSANADSLVRVADGAVAWYIRRAEQIVDRTGLCSYALELLRHAIHVVATDRWPQADERDGGSGALALPSAADLPVAPPTIAGQTEVRRLYGAFMLCAEYAAYCGVAMQDLCERNEQNPDAPAADESSSPVSAAIIGLGVFCTLEPSRRAQLFFRHSSASTVADDVRNWVARVSVEHCGVAANRASPGLSEEPKHDCDALLFAAEAACDATIEEVIMTALLGCVNSSGWDPASFQMIANIVQASNPTLVPADRVIKSSFTLLEFILGAVYSDDQRCRAVDIFEAVDMMYGCIPKADEQRQTDHADRWDELQRQADELERHLCCVELLHKHKISISLSFADLRRGLSNESMALRSVWNLFRLLGARYRPAVFWRGFKDELFYMHSHAFAAVSKNSVFEMFMRCLAEQEHFEVMSSVAVDWANDCNATEASHSLVALAQELVNSSPSLQHGYMEKARRVLKCVPQADSELVALAQVEADFIKACELLHDLVRFQPRQNLASRWVEDLRSINPIASLSQVTSAVSRSGGGVAGLRLPEPEVTAGDSAQASLAAGRMMLGAEGFPIDCPVQLRLQLHLPLRVVTELLEYNPPVMLESEELHRFLSLLGLGPSSACWAEVMAMCAAAHVLNGNRAEALNITEKLLANAHPSAWKLALALASEDSDTHVDGQTFLNSDHGSDLLADAAKVCPAAELPHLLGFFDGGLPADGGASVGVLSPEEQAADQSTKSCSDVDHRVLKARRGYACDRVQASSAGFWMRQQLGFEDSAEDTSPGKDRDDNWRGLHLWENSDLDWQKPSSLQQWGEALLPVDSDTGVALLDSASVLPPDGLPEQEKQIRVPPKASPARALDRLAGFGAPEAPARALDRLAGGLASSSPEKVPARALDRLAGGATVSSHDKAPAQALDRLAGFGAVPSPERASAQASDSIASGGVPPEPRRALDNLVGATTAPVPRQALDRLADGFGGAPEPRNALDSLAGRTAAPAPRQALDSLAEAFATPESSKPSSWSFGFGLQTVTGGLMSLMTASQGPSPEVGGESVADVERIAPQPPSPPTVTQPAPGTQAEASFGDLRRTARRLSERALGADEDTDGVPGARPDCDVLLSSLRSMKEICPKFDHAQQDAPLVDEVLKHVDCDSALKMIKAAAGVDVLHHHGVTTSAIALHAAKQMLRQPEGDTDRDDGLATFVHWLSAEDAASLLQEVPMDRQMELLGHVREASHSACAEVRNPEADRLQQVVRQAEVLFLLRFVYSSMHGQVAKLPSTLCLDANALAENVAPRWLEALAAGGTTAAEFAETAKDILHDQGFLSAGAG